MNSFEVQLRGGCGYYKNDSYWERFKAWCRGRSVEHKQYWDTEDRLVNIIAHKGMGFDQTAIKNAIENWAKRAVRSTGSIDQLSKLILKRTGPKFYDFKQDIEEALWVPRRKDQVMVSFLFCRTVPRNGCRTS